VQYILNAISFASGKHFYLNILLPPARGVDNGAAGAAAAAPIIWLVVDLHK